MKKLVPFLIALVLFQSATTQAQRITVTVAGSYLTGYSGDNGPAKKAALNQPYDVCADAARNLYFTDQNNTRIRKLTASTGVITTIAGGGPAYTDGVDALSSAIAAGNLCTDPVGNVYFVNSGTKVRRIDAVTNIITTIAGGGSSTGVGVPATSAALTAVNGICINPAGDLFIVVGNTVRKIDIASGMLEAFAGTGASGFTGDGGPAILATMHNPKYITSDHAGNLYFGDQNAGSFGDYIRRIDAVTGVITTVIGGGGILFGCAGSSCMIGPLSGLCCDNNDDVIFNEWSCSCRKWDHTSGWVSAVGGNFYIESFVNDTSSDFAYMNFNYGICADNANNYYIADRNNARIRKIMQLSHTPTFAFGESQSTKLCFAGANSLDSLLWVTDIDVAQTETWTVVTPPASGTLSGFPATAISGDIRETAKPVGTLYTPGASFTGADHFVVRVSDGTYADTITVYVQVFTPLSVTGVDNLCVGAITPMTATIPGGAWSIPSPNATITTTGMVTAVSAGTVNVLYEVSTACGVILNVHPMSIDTAATSGVVEGYETVCQGATITLTNTATGGVWSSSGTSASVSSTGVVLGVSGGVVNILYTVSGGGCGLSVASKTVTVIPAADAGAISGADEVCVGASITLTTTGSLGVWNVINGNANITSSGDIYGITAGPTTVHYNVVNECGVAEATKDIMVVACAPADIAAVSNEPSVSVFPNPAKGTLNVRAQGLQQGVADISLADVAGRVVLRSELALSNGTKKLDVSKLSEGVYMLTISGNGVHYINKVVISR